MTKTLRSQNKCNDCRYTWYPRGKNLSRMCPSCSSENVAVVVNWAPILAVVGVGLYLVFGGKASDRPPAGSQSPAPAQIAVPAENMGQIVVPPDPGAAPIRQRTAEKEEVIEPSRPARPQEQEVLPPQAAVPAPMSAPSAAIAKDTVTVISPSATRADENERWYSDEEISALEQQKQYQGNDPIVRSRLGIPSRETHKLIR